MSNRRRPTRARRANLHPLSMAAAAQRRLREKLAKGDKPKDKK